MVGKSAVRMAYITWVEGQTVAICMLERLKIQSPFSPLGLGLKPRRLISIQSLLEGWRIWVLMSETNDKG